MEKEDYLREFFSFIFYFFFFFIWADWVITWTVHPGPTQRAHFLITVATQTHGIRQNSRLHS